MNEQVEYIVGGILFSILGFFLKDVIDDVKELKKQNQQLRVDLDVLRNDSHNKYDNLTLRVDEIKDSVKELIFEIKNLTIELANKNGK